MRHMIFSTNCQKSTRTEERAAHSATTIASTNNMGMKVVVFLLGPVFVAALAVAVALILHDGSRSDPALLKQAIADHYDILSPFYQQVWGNHIHHGLWRTGDETDRQATDLLVHEMDRLCHVTSNMKLLDVGCGVGGAAVHHARNHSCHVTGITVSRTQVQMAQALAAEAGVTDRTRFLVMDAEEMDLPDDEEGTFDVVWTTEVLNHLHDRSAFFRHSARMLKPNTGVLCLMDWFKKDGLSEEEEKKWVAPIEYGMLNPSLGTMREYEQHARANKMKLVYAEDISEQSDKTWHRLTSVSNLGLILKILVTNFDVLVGMLKRQPRNLSELFAFLRSFWNMKEGFDNGTFLVAIQVYRFEE